MMTALAYRGRSGLSTSASGGQRLSFAPNLLREKVAFDASFKHPLRFREAMSTLHDVVVDDRRWKPKSDEQKASYERFKAQQKRDLQQLHAQAYHKARMQVAEIPVLEVPPELESSWQSARKRYWALRDRSARLAVLETEGIWRYLFPYDPICTVADDAVLFECFSADESTYGCLVVDRARGFQTRGDAQLGTTNVDYSWDLYHHFQELRSYREARLTIDPAGVGLTASEGAEGVFEEKIDLPASWLRGLLQIQTAMNLPLSRVELSPEAVYSILAFLKRKRARQSPRALRFELTPGKSPVVVLEPWGERIVSYATTFTGPEPRTVRVWGRDRLQVLARALPLAEKFEVHLLGNGQPSFWIVEMGEMKLVVGLSGWTANDWTRTSALDLLLPPSAPPAELVAHLSQVLQQRRSGTLAELTAASVSETSLAAAALNRLASQGQVIYDLTCGRYRWRQVLDKPLGDEVAGPTHPEVAGAKAILARDAVRIASAEPLSAAGGVKLAGKSDGCPVELGVDAEGRIVSGKCVCEWYRQAALKRGPCRHLLALRQAHADGRGTAVGDARADAGRKRTWFENLLEMAGGSRKS